MVEFVSGSPCRTRGRLLSVSETEGEADRQKDTEGTRTASRATLLAQECGPHINVGGNEFLEPYRAASVAIWPANAVINVFKPVISESSE